jgi:hypothetical protein
MGVVFEYMGRGRGYWVSEEGLSVARLHEGNAAVAGDESDLIACGV